MSRITIGVFGHYGNQNLGDEAITLSVIENFRRRFPDARFVGLSINPFDTAWRYDIEAFPIRFRRDYFDDPERRDPPPPHTPQPMPEPLPQRPLWWRVARAPRTLAGRVLRALTGLRNELFFLRRARQRLADIDLLVIAGSNQFLDNFGGPWGFPYTLCKWTLLAGRSGTKVAFMSMGAGPILQRFTYTILRMALRRADYVSYRDEGSRDLIERHIDGIDGPVVPDLAHALDEDLGTDVASPAAPVPDSAVTVMINPMPVFDPRYWFDKDEIRYAAYVDELARMSKALLDDGRAVVLFNTQPKDSNVTDDVAARLEAIGLDDAARARLQVVHVERLEALMALLRGADVVVATRFHATVLPLQLGIPTYGICYYRKAAELLDEAGMSDYHVRIEDFRHADALPRIAELIERRDTLPAQILARHGHFRGELEAQFDKVAALLKN